MIWKEWGSWSNRRGKEEIVDEIESIMSSGILPPGQAGKLRGKLMFGASQLWGKVGRAFLRALSERQYSSFSSVKVNSAINRSLNEWKFLLEGGLPRPIDLVEKKLVDAVIFTDGSFPDGKEGAPDKPWIGGVLFMRGRSPVQFGCEVAQTLIDEWIPRKSQIAMVELFAAIVALETFKQELKGSSALLFVDSEPVQGALVVKGYSAREDMCELVSVFWRCSLALRANFYIDRISTDANPADHPSRDRMDVGKKLGWIEVEPKLNGTRYMRETGAMLMSLKQDEQNGVIVLPAKIEGQPNHVTIAESWLPYGIPFAVVLGLALSNVVTNKEAIIPTFKRMMKNVRKEDMSLDLEEALGRLRRICHGVSLAADNYTQRLFDRDTCLVQPVMERLAGTEQLKYAGAGVQRGLSETFGSWCFYVVVPSGLLSLDGRSLLLIEPDPGSIWILLVIVNFNSSQIKGSTGSNDARMMTLSSTHVDWEVKGFCSKCCKGQTSVVQHVVQHVIGFLIFGWLVGMRRSILMLGSTLARFL